MGNILLAASVKPKQILCRLLTPHYEVQVVASVEEALQAAYANRPDLVLCTLLFDESRSIELLRAMKTDPQVSDIPFITCRAVKSKISEADMPAIVKTAYLLGACQFIDLVELSRDGRTFEAINLIDSHLPPEKRSTAVRQAG